MNKPIGGFFELELERNQEFYPDYFRFNFARHAVSYFFKCIEITTIWIPSYICESLIKTLENDKFKLKFYNMMFRFVLLVFKIPHQKLKSL